MSVGTEIENTALVENERRFFPKLKLTDVEASKASQRVSGEGFRYKPPGMGSEKKWGKLIKQIKEPIDPINNKLIFILFASQPFITNLEHHPVKLLSKS